MRGLLIFFTAAFATVAQGNSILAEIPLLNSCPFVHTDRYSMDSLHNLIKQRLREKISEHQKCLAPFNDVSTRLDRLENSFKYHNNPTIREDITDEVLAKQLLQLRQYQMSDTFNVDQRLMVDSILRLDDRIYQNQIAGAYNRDFFREQRELEAIKTVFREMNGVIRTMVGIDPDCLQYIGGWQQVMPAMLNSVSSLSGLSGLAYASVISAGIQLVASMSVLLQNREAKKAFKEIVEHRNNKILACMYYAVQNTACSYEQSLRFASQKDKIIAILKMSYPEARYKRYFEFTDLSHKVNEFESVFRQIASMGSGIMLDVDMVSKYFVAARSRPGAILEEIGQPPEADATGQDVDDQRVIWLTEVRNRGISFSEIPPFSPGHIKPADQVREALADIQKKLADMHTAEKVLSTTRSFVHLNHDLSSKFNMLSRVSAFQKYFANALSGRIVKNPNKGLIADALTLIGRLERFLSVDFDSFVKEGEDPQNLEHLEKIEKRRHDEINRRGRELFSSMAEGAVAHVSRQSVLSIGSVVQKRLIRVFQHLEEEFLREDLTNNNLENMRYIDFKRDNQLIHAANEYEIFQGSARTFRAEDIDIAYATLEHGYWSEMKSLLQGALSARTSISELEGVTAAHMCALFAPTLTGATTRQSHGRVKKRLLAKCQKRFKELHLLDIFEPSTMEINWGDRCFYPMYQNFLDTQRSLKRKMGSLGFENY